ncbi:hypothetical protein [Tolypothrix sp. NIES-4075]|uniref:hypothetical protein n=1 Tax=Tolypothrix sp. NIES-4075 TaxID=2005459 RepID=UPI001F48C746|nr:hypothetical protein [Tolypothrix sp. NIES-4075]
MKARYLKKVVFGTAMAIALLSTANTPSLATTLPFQSDNPLAKVFEQFTSQLGSLQSYVSSILSDKIQPLAESLGGDLQAAIDEAMGALGLPDPTVARKEVEKIGAAIDAPVNPVENATNEVDRQITRAVSASTLGKEGQERQKEQIQRTQQSIERVQQQATTAQSEVVTQNVMKQIAQQNAQQAAILGAMRADGLKQQQSQDLANINLTNISRSVDGQNQAKQRETVGQGFQNYRTTAKARLF